MLLWGAVPLVADRGIADCRLPVPELCPLARLTNRRTGGRKGALPEKDGENEGSSWDVYEKKGGKTKCLVTNSNAHTKMHLSHANRHYFCGFSTEDATIT
jgi:hypothetical protein